MTHCQAQSYVESIRPDLAISKGNSKLGKDTIIINMNSATDCPSSALGLCKLGRKCYALKAEKLYPTCLPYRRRQNEYWVSHSAIEIAADLLKVIKRGRIKIKFVRLSESGDFESQSDIEKADLIARHLKKHGIVMYCYSARSDLNFSDCTSLLVKGSSHDNGNNGRTIARPRKAIDADLSGGTYTEKIDGFRRYFAVCPGSCKSCDMCKQDNGLNIVFPIH